MAVAAVVYAAIAIGVQIEQAFFAKNPDSLGRYTTIGGNLLLLGDAIAGPPPEGQRLGDLQLAQTVEGSPLNRCIGPENRVPGTVVWMSALREVKDTQHGGGKGGSGGEFIVYQYYLHALIQFCRARVPISRIPKLWADGKEFQDLQPTSEITSSAWTTNRVSIFLPQGGNLVEQVYMEITSPTLDLLFVRSGSAARLSVSGYVGGSITTGLVLVSLPVPGAITIILRSTTGSPISLQVNDLLEFTGYAVSYTVAANVTVPIAAGGISVLLKNVIQGTGGFNGTPTTLATATSKRSVAINNGLFSVVSATFTGETGGGYSVVRDSKIRLADFYSIGGGRERGQFLVGNPFRSFTSQVAGASTITLRQQNPAFKTSQVREIHHLLGGPNQILPQGFIQLANSAVDLYGMQNRAGILLEDLNLTDFGNRLGNFEALIEVTPHQVPVSEAIRTVLEDDAGISPAQIDTTLVTGRFVRGFTIRGPLPPKRSLQALLGAYDIGCWERGGVLFFANRENLPQMTIPLTDLGSRASRDEDGRAGRLVINDPSRDSLPSEVVLQYRSPENDYQTATKRSKRTEKLATNLQQIQLELVLTQDEAQQIVDRMLALAWGAQRELAVRLPPSMAGRAHEGMILNFGPLYGQNWKMLVERLDRGANMAMIATGREIDLTIGTQTATGEGTLGITTNGNSQEPPTAQPPLINMILMDIPALSDQHRAEPGIYIAAQCHDPTRAWRGGILFWSTDGGVTWARVTNVVSEAVIGTIVTPPSVAILPDLWDRVNTIRVKFDHPQVQLASVAEDECIAGRNRFLVGLEIVGASRVQFVSYDPNERAYTYDLSILLRGQQDTDQVMNAHVAGEVVVWLDGPGIQFQPLSFSHVDKERIWLMVPHGGGISDGIPQQFALTGRNCKPFHVRDIHATRDGSSNLTWTWERTSRAARTFLEQGEPLDEEVEQYEIDVTLSGVVKRTIVATGARTATYTAAQHTTDGITPGNPVTARFYQISQGLRRGQETEVTL